MGTIMAENRATASSSAEIYYRILYSSKVPKSRAPDEVEDDIEAILRASRGWNIDVGITGVLVTNKRMYAQIIEGPALVVKDLLGHIACDRRHSDVRIISSHHSDKRIFTDWSMAFVRTNRDLQAEAYMFPTGDEQSNILAVSAFCMSVRDHVLNGENF